MITISNLVKRYGDKLALDHLDLHVGKGVVFGLLGPNGAGKTTLVSVLNGLTDFDEGKVEIFGLDMPRERAAIRRRSAFIPQSLALYENLSVIENLRFFGGIQEIAAGDLKRNIDYAVSVNRLETMLDQRAGTLSGGQKRRLNIAIGLLNDPDILYFDEPTVGIDPESRNEILETIRSFKESEKSVIYTSHYMPEIEKICDEVAIIDRGSIIRQGSLESMLESEKADSAVIELHHPGERLIGKIAKGHRDIEVVDVTTLMLHRQDSAKMAALLAELEKSSIAIRQVRYGTTNLESLFIRLTSRGANDV
jgi:ABC-2 type transport system ATP-binding protein